jgi:hypothetical protein
MSYIAFFVELVSNVLRENAKIVFLSGQVSRAKPARSTSAEFLRKKLYGKRIKRAPAYSQLQRLM